MFINGLTLLDHRRDRAGVGSHTEPRRRGLAMIFAAACSVGLGCSASLLEVRALICNMAESKRSLNAPLTTELLGSLMLARAPHHALRSSRTIYPCR